MLQSTPILPNREGDESAVLIKQRVEQMFWDERLVVVLSLRYVLRVLYCLNGLLSIVLSVHKNHLLSLSLELYYY